jgi:hypothetical protein
MKNNVHYFTLPKSTIKGWAIVLAAFVVFCFASGQQAVADIVPGTVSTDPFDSTQGTVVVAHDTIVDPINAFRTSGGFEDGHTLMQNGGLNSVSFITFDTASLVSIVGVRLFAHNDEKGCCLRRAMNHFTLFADTDGDSVFETTVVDQAINPAYNSQPGNNATGVGDLDLTLSTGGVITAQHWCLEVTQGSDIQPYEGARLVELDAISIDQLCPCESQWKNHGAYVSCVAHAAEDFVAQGLISEVQKDAIVSEAGASSCGKKDKKERP